MKQSIALVDHCLVVDTKHVPIKRRLDPPSVFGIGVRYKT